MRASPATWLLALIGAACGEAFAPRLPVSVVPSALRLTAGDTARLVASGPRWSVRWRSTEPSIATVELNGLVTAVARGVASVWAVRGADSASASVEVRVKVCAGIALMSPANAIVAVGDTIRAEARLGGCSPDAVDVVWVTSDSAIAVVASRGEQGAASFALVTARRPGQAAITAKGNDDYASLAVTVREP